MPIDAALAGPVCAVVLACVALAFELRMGLIPNVLTLGGLGLAMAVAFLDRGFAAHARRSASRWRSWGS